MTNYELDDLDRALLKKIKRGVAYEDNGDPIRDVLDEDDMTDACPLLLRVLGEEPTNDR